MHPILLKTFGGLTREYYFRQLFFALIFAAAFVFLMQRPLGAGAVGMYFYIAISTLLYPYSRFVYESIVGFIIGNNVFYFNAILVLVVKYLTMSLCFALAIFIAPIGLAYLYYHHSK